MTEGGGGGGGWRGSYHSREKKKRIGREGGKDEAKVSLEETRKVSKARV